MSDRMQEKLVIGAVQMAIFRRKITAELILHSDRGRQYAAEDFQKILAENGITCSMSRAGDCCDNAVTESFFHTLKTECVYHENFETRKEAKKNVFEYIEVFYNRKRLHSFLNYKSPAEFECLQTTI